MLTVLVDKLLKMQIVDPAIVEAWVFCDDMKREFKRSWTFDVLNTAIVRMEKHLDVLKSKQDDLTRLLDRKRAKLAASGREAKGDDEKMDEDGGAENGQATKESDEDITDKDQVLIAETMKCTTGYAF